MDTIGVCGESSVRDLADCAPLGIASYSSTIQSVSYATLLHSSWIIPRQLDESEDRYVPHSANWVDGVEDWAVGTIWDWQTVDGTVQIPAGIRSSTSGITTRWLGEPDLEHCEELPAEFKARQGIEQGGPDGMHLRTRLGHDTIYRRTTNHGSFRSLVGVVSGLAGCTHNLPKKRDQLSSLSGVRVRSLGRSDVKRHEQLLELSQR